MTISSQNRTAGPFIGNGAAGSFPFSFKVFSASDVVVVRSDGSTQSTLTLNSDYTVQVSLDQDNAAGGSVVLTNPLAAGLSLVITSNVAELQGLSITNNGGFYPRIIEQAFDRLTILIQQLRAIANRSLRFPISDTGVNTELPTKTSRAGNLLGFDLGGNPVAIAPVAQSATALQLDLLNASDASKGAAMVGYGGQPLDTLLKVYTGRVVQSIAALRQLAKGKATQAFVTGYYANGDGGGGPYYLDAADTASADNGGTVIVAADGGRWKLILIGERISVKQFGARGNGAGDDTAAIQAAINWRGANGCGSVFFPAGYYRTSTTLTYDGVGLTIEGEGKYASAIVGTFAAGDLLRFGDGVANPAGCVVQAIGFQSTVVKTSGAAIRFRNGHYLIARDFAVNTNMFTGIALDGGSGHFEYFINNFEIAVSNIGIEVGSDGKLIADAWITDGLISGGYQGLVIRHGSGIYASRIDMISCADYGIGIVPGSGQSVSGSFFDTVLGDTCGNQGWKIFPSGTGAVSDINVQNCWAATTNNAGGSGMLIDGPANSITNLQFTNFRWINNRGHGCVIGSGRGLSFANCCATANSQASAGTYSGIYFYNLLSDIQITGGVYGGYNGFPANQAAGIAFAGAMSFLQVIGVNTRNNVVSGISNPPPNGGNIVFANNL